MSHGINRMICPVHCDSGCLCSIIAPNNHRHRIHQLHTIADLKDGLLNNATRLQISEDLTEFPQEIFEVAETLEVLDLSNNQLSDLPADFARLSELKILFLSNNQFKALPAVLADCPKLEMIGFKANQIVDVPENALPLSTRWLILTDNKIQTLPESMGDLSNLQKLMLAGNELTTLPDSMAKCRALQLVRLSANKLNVLPEFLLELPKLSWLAFSGNPFCVAFSDDSSAAIPAVGFDDVELHEVLGQGASGVILRANWINPIASVTDATQAIAVKQFKGQVTSDGYPEDELHACLAAGKHANLVPVIAKIEQGEQLGLVMGLIDPDYTNLGEPPTFQSCTRDHFDDDFMVTVAAVLKISRSIMDTLLHLRERDICHGDLYAHNILTNSDADVLFGDFGAASNYASLSASQAAGLEKIEVRAFGCLLEDLIGSSCDSDDCPDMFESLVLLKNRCMHPKGHARPTLAEIKSDLDAIEG